ncbi:MAG TPA: citrate/2-methylcitrate synthase [Streptosporangiaceae bacterium]|nr:citrate/2-methylcitrate synthase [Streptosporangiaceae bacterium]
MSEFLTAAEAAQRLGVKPATLYAYVSRGVLRRDLADDGRRSLFDSDEVERLARRGRPRRPAGAADITVESAITEITGDRLFYRGLDAIRLAASRTFEDVAELLWTGELPASRGARSARPPGSVPWRATPAALAAGRGAQTALPAGTLPLERFQVIVPAMATTDPLRLQLDPAAVLAAGRSIIAGLVDCLPPAAPAAPAAPDYPISDYPSTDYPSTDYPNTDYPSTDYPRTDYPRTDYPIADYPIADYPIADYPIADRLWSRLCERRPSPALRRALSAALVLLADHELAASTLAVRVAASVRADPYAVVETGMGAMSGALHGGASLGVETLLAAASGPDDVPRVVGELLRRGEKVPGFGHFVYRTGDPRAVLLFDLVRRAAPKSGQLAVAEAVLAEVRRKSLPEPNIDLAIATLARVAGMIRGSGEAIFAVARTAGWIAHALEAYAGPGPLRPRAVYMGRPPAADA